jgi:hypothetical protein
VYAENPAVNLTSIEGSSLILDISVDDLAPIDEYYTKGEEFILQKTLDQFALQQHSRCVRAWR